MDAYAGPETNGIEIIAKLRKMGHPIAWYNMGGGFGIGDRDDGVMAIEEFAHVIVPAVEATKLAFDDGTRPRDCRDRGHTGQSCGIYQAVGREAVPDFRMPRRTI